MISEISFEIQCIIQIQSWTVKSVEKHSGMIDICWTHGQSEAWLDSFSHVI